MSDTDRPVLILGAGINGAALARELLLNRVPVCLVDTADIASGATACSSRLIHGGLRYLEYGELRLVRESLDERTRLLSLAPQFVRPLRLAIPLRTRATGFVQATGRLLGWPIKPAPRGLWLVRLGLWLYDTFAHPSRLGRHRVHKVDDPQLPRVSAARYRWLCSYADAQIQSPERFVLALLEDAQLLAAAGRIWFQVFTYHRATVAGQTVEIRACKPLAGDIASDKPVAPVTSFQPAAIVNATGAWVDHTLGRLNVPSRRLIGGTKGSHIFTFNANVRRLLRGQGVYAEAADGRPIFMLPLGAGTLIGTTDVPFDESPEKAVCSEHERDYLLSAVNEILPDITLHPEDVDLHCSGVRPLPYVGGRAPAGITRRHWLEENMLCPLPMYSMIGGKLTTCRSMAEETTATILASLGRSSIASSRDRIIPGGEDYPDGESALAERHERLARAADLTPAQVNAVWSLCGTRAESILTEATQQDSDRRAGRDNLSGTAIPLRFAGWVVRNEWVASLSDLVERRLMLLYHPALTERCLMQLARLMVEEGRLASGDEAAEIRACVERLRTHYGRRVLAADSARQPQ